MSQIFFNEESICNHRTVGGIVVVSIWLSPMKQMVMSWARKYVGWHSDMVTTYIRMPISEHIHMDGGFVKWKSWETIL